MSYIIRLAKPEEYIDVAHVAKVCFPTDYKKGGDKESKKEIAEDWTRKRMDLFPYSITFVAVDNETSKIVGYGLYLMIGGLSGVVQLEQLAVLPEYQRRGIGRQIMEEAEPLIEKHLTDNFNIKLFKFVLTTSMDNPSSHQLYIKQGYTKTGDLGVLFYEHVEVMYSKEYK